jgi:sorting nexin-8
MILADERESGAASNSMAEYSIDDPWTSSAPPSRLDAPSSSSRPLTWAPGNSERTNSTARHQTSDPGEDSTAGEPSGARSPLLAPVYINPNPCTVHLLPDLGGYILFHHVLYLVKTPQSAGVKRRYSDFVSLHEYLITRYPFRLIPPLPPKRLALPHISKTQAVGSKSQDVFLEQRRLALARFTRNVISHPVLAKDIVVVSFYTKGALQNGADEDNASTWKSPGVADGIVEQGLDESWKLTDSELMSVPVDMEDKLVNTKKMVSVIVDRLNNTVAVFERQVRRMEATATESSRLSLSLSSLLEVESQVYLGSQTEDIFAQSTNLLIHNSQDYADLSTARFITLQRTLDGLKNSRDIWLSLKELFKRHEKLGGDPIRDLLLRIEANRKRWKLSIEEKKPNWKETCTRLKEEVELDQKLIERYERRNKRVRVSIWQEVSRLQHLENLIVDDWKAYAKSEAVNLAATKLAAEELVVALDKLTQ